MSCASAWSGFATAPPWRPECRSLAGPVSVSSSAARPRLATVIDGSSMRHIAPSAETTTSAFSMSLFCLPNSSRCLLQADVVVSADGGFQHVLVLPDKLFQVLAADLFFAFDHELHVDR